MPGPDASFWQQRFERGDTPWDRGAPSPQLQAWLAEGRFSREDLQGQVAIPGCGSGHEVTALARTGVDVIGLDFAAEAVALTRQRLQAEGLDADGRVEQANVLQWQPRQPLAAVYEQTCLCALHPDRWSTYARQLHQWLRPGGLLFALFLQRWRETAAQGFIEGPPYHCDINAMRALFPDAHWIWPKPPYPDVPDPVVGRELAVVLTRR